jgi:hypothetical protein
MPWSEPDYPALFILTQVLPTTLYESNRVILRTFDIVIDKHPADYIVTLSYIHNLTFSKEEINTANGYVFTGEVFRNSNCHFVSTLTNVTPSISTTGSRPSLISW